MKVSIWFDVEEDGAGSGRLLIRGVGPFSPQDKIFEVEWDDTLSPADLILRAAAASKEQGVPVPDVVEDFIRQHSGS